MPQPSPPPDLWGTRRGALLAVACALLAVGLQIVAIHAHSLTGDGAHHLLAGHQALRYGQNRLNLEHPPLVKLVAALPLAVAAQPLAPPLRVEQALGMINTIHEQPVLLRRGTITGRYLVLLAFGLPFLAACYGLGRHFGGPGAGVVLAAMVAFSACSLANLTILQTDTALALAYGLTLLAAFRYRRAPTLDSALLLGSAFGLGLAVKHSALLLLPTLLLALLPSAWAEGRRRSGHLLAAGLMALALLHLTYAAANLAYRSAEGRETIRSYSHNQGTVTVHDRLRAAEPWLLRLEAFDPYLAQWLTGLLGVRAQNAIGPYPSYAFGTVRSDGRWWYFPALLLVKVPLPVLVAGLLALVAVLRRRPAAASGRASPWRRDGWLVAVTAGVYLLGAMASRYNLGVRHLLPVLPFLFLPIALVAARRRWSAALLVGALALEAVLLTPLWMSATNTWWLGAHNPSRFALGAGNLEFRQNFVQLARAAEQRQLHGLRVLYPTLDERVVRAYLPDARLAVPGDPVVPGWYAVNVTVEQFIPALLRASPATLYDYAGLHRLAERWLPFWQQVATGRDEGYVAATFHLYHVGAEDPLDRDDDADP